jgi:L-asparaginase
VVLSVAEECADEGADEGADGIGITQGTDTLDESAYLLDLWWSRQAPLVVTGRMRGASDPGADGPSNLVLPLSPPPTRH